MASAGAGLVASGDKASAAALPLPTRDKVTIGLIAFFVIIASTLEAYWLIFNQVMEQRHDAFAKALAVYWPADYTYRISGYPLEKCFTISVESLNTFVFQPLSLLLIYGIVKRKHWRYPLQLLISMPVFYGTVLYYYVAILSGYAAFAYKGSYPYLMLYLSNAPWFFAYLYFIYDATGAILRRLSHD